MTDMPLNGGQIIVWCSWDVADTESLAQMIKNPTVVFCLAFVLKWGQLNSWAGRSSQLPEGLIIQLCLKVKTNISSGLSWSHSLVSENSFPVKRCLLSPAAHCRANLFFYPIYVLDASIPHSFSAPSSPSLERNVGKKKEVDHFSEAQQPPLDGKKRLTHGMKLRDRGHLCVRADSGG